MFPSKESLLNLHKREVSYTKATWGTGTTLGIPGTLALTDMVAGPLGRMQGKDRAP